MSLSVTDVLLVVIAGLLIARMWQAHDQHKRLTEWLGGSLIAKGFTDERQF